MEEYKVGFRVESGLNSHLPRTLFKLKDDVECELKFPTDDHLGRIHAFIKLKGENNLDAVTKARQHLEELLDAVSLIMDSSLYAEEVFLVLKNEKGKKERFVLRSTVKEGISGLYIKEITKDGIEALWKKQKSPEVEIALRWLRLGNRSRSFHERFFYYWLALERFVGESQVTRQCEKCGHPHIHPGIDKKKVKELMQTECNISDSNFDDIWKIRHIIFHGRKRLNTELHDRIRLLIPFIFTTLGNAISKKMGIQHKLCLEKPSYFMTRENKFMYLKFQTLNPNDEFATDYPTDEQVKEFSNNHEVSSHHGFELVKYDETSRKW
jgi:hypothetical protein